jgi:hypothetical protein
MHVRVGGFMGAFNSAGLDPLFWLHHCNIDRLWEVWRKMSATHKDPVRYRVAQPVVRIPRRQRRGRRADAVAVSIDQDRATAVRLR